MQQYTASHQFKCGPPVTVGLKTVSIFTDQCQKNLFHCW